MLLKTNVNILSRFTRRRCIPRPKVSEVLTAYLQQRDFPHWTSYFVRYSDVVNDQKGCSHFNWKIADKNYHILRTGCYPYMKYHCTQRPHEDLTMEDKLFRVIKVMNLGIPCLAYGIAATFLFTHVEQVQTSSGKVPIFFLYKEDIGAVYWEIINIILIFVDNMKNMNFTCKIMSFNKPFYSFRFSILPYRLEVSLFVRCQLH